MGESLTRQIDCKQHNYKIAGMLGEEYRKPEGAGVLVKDLHKNHTVVFEETLNSNQGPSG